MKAEIENIVIDKIKGGDFSACNFIVDKYKAFVFNICIRIVKNKEDAEEVAQDSFIKAFKSIDGFKHESKFSTWLYRITFNNAISKTRGKKVFESEINESVTEAVNLSYVSDGLENLNRIDRKVVLKKALDKLSQEENLLVSLYYFEENSIAEVSEITGYEVNYIKVKVHRARKKLYHNLSEIMGIKMEDVL
jgi:RNA polymerase sigma-70 factor (ECF subfamily)